MDALTRRYRALAFAALKWTLILCLVGGLGAGISTLVAVPAVQKASKPKGVLVEKTPAGEDRFVYGEDKTPQNFEQEMDYPPEQLIYQKQQRFNEPEDQQPDDGGRMDRVAVPESDRRQIARTLERFLARWETFPARRDADRYRDTLRDLVDPATLSQIAARVDSRERYSIGRDTGSKLPASVARQDVSDSLSVLRYSPESAYVSVSARVTYTGPSLVWKDRQMLRTYGVVLVRSGSGWKVARAAAETLSELT